MAPKKRKYAVFKPRRSKKVQPAAQAWSPSGAVVRSPRSILASGVSLEEVFRRKPDRLREKIADIEARLQRGQLAEPAAILRSSAGRGANHEDFYDDADSMINDDGESQPGASSTQVSPDVRAGLAADASARRSEIAEPVFHQHAEVTVGSPSSGSLMVTTPVGLTGGAVRPVSPSSAGAGGNYIQVISGFPSRSTAASCTGRSVGSSRMASASEPALPPASQKVLAHVVSSWLAEAEENRQAGTTAEQLLLLRHRLATATRLLAQTSGEDAACDEGHQLVNRLYWRREVIANSVTAAPHG